MSFMSLNARTVFSCGVCSILILVWAGCASHRPRSEGAPPITSNPSPERAGKAASDSSDKAMADDDNGTGVEDQNAKKEVEDFLVQQAKDARTLEKLKRDLAIARERLNKTKISADHSEQEHEASLRKAHRDSDLALKRMNTFAEREAPNRIEWAKLGLINAEDRLKDAEEELHQLELMYEGENLADQTKEIVLDRGRRRLERSRRDLELRQEDFAILTEKTIPMEMADHESRVEEKRLALEKAERAVETNRLDQKINLMQAESEVMRLEGEIEAHQEEMERKQRDFEEKPSEKVK